MKLIILSGRSGSGKSVALKALEDQGYYCVDNLPPPLLLSLLESIESKHKEVAVSIDARSDVEALKKFSDIHRQLKQKSENCTIIFVDADDSTLLKRYSETRRRHPLMSAGQSLPEAICAEKKYLESITALSDLIIDSSDLSPYQLKNNIISRVKGIDTQMMNISFQSFGYKHGVPADSDFIFDARCLPNPYWDKSLRAYNGKDEEIINYLKQEPLVLNFIWQIRMFMQSCLSQFERDNRSYLTISIGCTGGQHRSVYVAEQLVKHFQNDEKNVHLRHRELK